MEDTARLSPFAFWEKIGQPKTVVAPMVDHSDLAYRMMTRKYGAELVFTQMFNSNTFMNSPLYREHNFTTCDGDRPLVVQFAGREEVPPKMVVQAPSVEIYNYTYLYLAPARTNIFAFVF